MTPGINEDAFHQTEDHSGHQPRLRLGAASVYS